MRGWRKDETENLEFITIGEYELNIFTVDDGKSWKWSVLDNGILGEIKRGKEKDKRQAAISAAFCLRKHLEKTLKKIDTVIANA